MKIFSVGIAVSMVATLAMPAPLQAQSKPQTPVFPAALRARLRLQVLALVPVLRKSHFSFQGAESLAIPLAQLGDFEAAQRLAQSAGARNALYQWRASQLAWAGKWDESSLIAARIAAPQIRADASLLLARLQIERGQDEIARRELASFSRLKTGVSANQLAYGGYLWARAGDIEAAQRVWKRAYSLAMAEKKAEAKERPRRDSDTSENSVATLEAAAVRPLVLFMAHAGAFRQALPFLEKADNLTFDNFTTLARNSAQLQVLREWLATQDGPDTARKWQHLALASALYGDETQSRQDRRQVEEVTKNSKAPLLAPDIYVDFVLGLQWRDKAWQSKIEDRARIQFKDLPQFALPSEAETVFWHLVTWQNGQPQLNPKLSRGELEEISEKAFNSKSVRLNLIGLNFLALSWHQRGDKAQTLRVARAMVEAGRSQSQKENRERGSDDAWKWRGGRELQGAAWLQKLGQNAESEAVARRFARETPRHFQSRAALLLISANYASIAAEIFDPAQEIKRQTAQNQARLLRYREYERRGKPFPNEKTDWSVFSDWNTLAATQAIFIAPDAPAKWFGLLDSPNAKASVLAAWIGAFQPQPRLAQPFVRFFASGNGYSGSSSY